MDAIVDFNPIAAEAVKILPLAKRLGTLKGKKIGFVDNSKLNADRFLIEVRKHLVAEYGIVEGPSFRKLAPKDWLKPEDLAALEKCDAVIMCFGDCGTSTSITVGDAVKLEVAGIPTLTVFSTAFVEAAKAQAGGRGMPNLHVVAIPHPMHTALASEVTARAVAAVPAIAEGLTVEGKGAVVASAAKVASTVDLSDDEEIFFANGWTDGLPVVIPTAAKVEAMLAASGRNPSDVIGPIPPAMKEASIEKLAINAVMAGCRPEYFPVVLAALEAALEDAFQLYSIQTATNTTAPMTIVNGPIVKQLGINSGTNALGQSNRANATIGRALQLILRNVGGDYPGVTDMATHGQPGKYTSCIAEAEENSPWEPYHVEVGFKAEDSTVTMVGASAPQNIFSYGCENGAEIMDHFIGAMLGLGHNNILFPSGPMLIIAPEHAHTLHRDGYSKKTIREMIFEKARIPLSRFAERTVKGLHHRRSRWFETVGDPNHIGVADSPDHVHIIVAGGAGIHSVFVPTGFNYNLVTRKISGK
jgi:hypothetical protein